MTTKPVASTSDALAALANSDELLRRLSEWDALNVPLHEGDCNYWRFESDRNYWLGLIDNARTLNRIALEAHRGN